MLNSTCFLIEAGDFHGHVAPSKESQTIITEALRTFRVPSGFVARSRARDKTTETWSDLPAVKFVHPVQPPVLHYSFRVFLDRYVAKCTKRALDAPQRDKPSCSKGGGGSSEVEVLI